jgi:hypothetical protein
MDIILDEPTPSQPHNPRRLLRETTTTTTAAMTTIMLAQAVVL